MNCAQMVASLCGHCGGALQFPLASAAAAAAAAANGSGLQLQCPHCKQLQPMPTAHFQPPATAASPVALPHSLSLSQSVLQCHQCQLLLTAPPSLGSHLGQPFQCPRCLSVIDHSHSQSLSSSAATSHRSSISGISSNTVHTINTVTSNSASSSTPSSVTSSPVSVVATVANNGTAPTLTSSASSSSSLSTESSASSSLDSESLAPTISTGGSSKKKRKDPDAPKRSSNAYMIFCQEHRAVLKVNDPSLPFGRIGQRLGEIWRAMSADERQPYEQRANVDRSRYKEQMNAYQTHAIRAQVQHSHRLALENPALASLSFQQQQQQQQQQLAMMGYTHKRMRSDDSNWSMAGSPAPLQLPFYFNPSATSMFGAAPPPPQSQLQSLPSSLPPQFASGMAQQFAPDVAAASYGSFLPLQLQQLQQLQQFQFPQQFFQSAQQQQQQQQGQVTMSLQPAMLSNVNASPTINLGPAPSALSSFQPSAPVQPLQQQQQQQQPR